MTCAAASKPRTVLMSGMDFDGTIFSLSYPFIQDDGGRASSRRPRQTNDCTVRALAIARKIPYDEAYEILAAAGRKCSKGFDFSKWVGKQPWAEKLSFPAKKGEKRMNPATFHMQFNQGVFICRTAKHVFAVKDGVVHDTWEQRPDRCIYTAFRINA